MSESRPPINQHNAQQELPEEYLKDVEYTIVPKGTVWLQGDNIFNSTDSRVYGPVPFAMLRGRVSHKVCDHSVYES